MDDLLREEMITMSECTPERVEYRDAGTGGSLVPSSPPTRLEVLHQQAVIAAEIMFYVVLRRCRKGGYPYGTHHPGNACGQLIREAGDDYSIGDAALIARTYMERYNELRRRQILPELSVVEVVKGLDWVMPKASAEMVQQIQEALLRWSDENRRRALKDVSE